MLSLGDIFNEDEIIKFDERIKKEGFNPKYVVEQKIDGLAISLLYKDEETKVKYYSSWSNTAVKAPITASAHSSAV